MRNISPCLNPSDSVTLRRPEESPRERRLVVVWSIIRGGVAVECSVEPVVHQARPLDRDRGQRRPPEAPRPEFIPILVQMKRPEVVAVSWPAIVSNRALAIGAIISAATISIVAISLLIQVG